MNRRFACYKQMMLLLALLVSLQAAAQPYQSTIYVPETRAEEGAGAALVVQDMVYWLHRATGRMYEVSTDVPSAGTGIQLQWADKSKLPAAVLQQLNADGQSFYLSIQGDRKVLIVGTGTNSFTNGIYTFLYELGFRWYMPGDAWTIVPDLKGAARLKVDKVYTPSFRNRTYFGTGSVRAIPDVDPNNAFMKDFQQWNLRNRYTYDFTTQGHVGKAFYKDNNELLDQHPEYFCNHTINKSGRIDIANKDAVALFVSWALKQLASGNRFPVIGVEPADGSGGKDDCLPSQMPEIKTWSDKYFWLANQVAREARQKNPDAMVQLLAYASHTAPPDFELEPNVYPVIVPYAFQNDALPYQFVLNWHQKMKGRPMGLYDYWNITQWSVGQPQFDIYSIPEKLRLWKANNITTVKLESTYSKGPMGHALWLAGQMMWNVDQDFETLYNQFLNDCFGPAAPDIRRMYDRWSKNYQGNMEWMFSKKDLDRAAAKTKDPAILKRIDELTAYVQYLKLLSEYELKPTTSAYEQLIQYVYDIHPLRLVQTTALTSRFIKKPEAIKVHNKAAEEDDYDSGEEALTVAPGQLYPISKFSFDIHKARVVPVKTPYQPTAIIGTNKYQFELSQPGNLTFMAGATKDAPFRLTDSTGREIHVTILKGSEAGYQAIQLSLPAGTYTLAVGAFGRKTRVIFPADIPFFSKSRYYDNYKYPLLYIYVPKDVSEIVYRDAKGPGINRRGNWIDPAGKTIQPVRARYDVYRVPVPPAQRGKVWVLNIGYNGFEMLNIPDVYSLNPFSYQE